MVSNGVNKKVILYIDDQKRDSFIEQIRARLGEGFAYYTAHNGLEALDAYNAVLDKQEELAILVGGYGVVNSKGSDLLPKIERQFPDAVVVLLLPSVSADLNLSQNVNLNLLLVEPVETERLVALVEKAAHVYLTQTESQMQHRHLRSLVRAGQELAQETEQSRVVTRTVQYALSFSRAERAYFIFLDKGKYRIDALSSADPAHAEKLKSEYNADSERFLTELSRSINEALQDDTFPHYRTVIFLKSKGKNIAYLYLENAESRMPFQPLQYDLLHLLSAQAAVVLENLQLAKSLMGRARELSEEIEKDEEYQMMFELTKKDVQDANRFAEAVQRAFLPSAAALRQYFPESFLFFKPKEIVSSDFYWFAEKYYKYFVAAGDSAVRGVRGAFLTVIVSNQLEQLADEALMLEPGAALARLDEHIRDVFRSNRQFGGVNLALCAIDLTIHKLEFAGAGRSLIVLRRNNIYVLEGAPTPLGLGAEKAANIRFESRLFSIEPEDTFYMVSNGFLKAIQEYGIPLDQTSVLPALLQEAHLRPMDEQARFLEEATRPPEGEVLSDDVLVIGVKIGQAMLE